LGKFDEPPYTGPYVRWCGETGTQQSPLLPDWRVFGGGGSGDGRRNRSRSGIDNGTGLRYVVKKGKMHGVADG